MTTRLRRQAETTLQQQLAPNLLAAVVRCQLHEAAKRVIQRCAPVLIRMGSTAPALDGSSRDPSDLACLPQAGTARLGLANGTKDQTLARIFGVPRIEMSHM